MATYDLDNQPVQILSLRGVAKSFEKGISIDLEGASKEFCFKVAMVALERFYKKTGDKVLKKSGKEKEILCKDAPA